MDRCSSVVECQTLNRESPGLNPLYRCFEAWAFSFSPRRPGSLSCINEYLAIDSGGNVSVYSLRVIAAWLEFFPEKLSWFRNEPDCQGVKCNAL